MKTNTEELYDIDIDEVMNQEFYCHLCSEEGVETELESTYYVEQVKSYRLNHDKYVAVAEKACPRLEHGEVDFQLKEGFYSRS